MNELIEMPKRVRSPIGGREEKKIFIESSVIVIPFSGCWIWARRLNSVGYGMTRWNKKPIQAHRMSYEVYNGPIPDGYFVCHHCDVPECVNPSHLYAGTPMDNMHDAIRRNRDRPYRARGSTEYVKLDCSFCKKEFIREARYYRRNLKRDEKPCCSRVCRSRLIWRKAGDLRG